MGSEPIHFLEGWVYVSVDNDTANESNAVKSKQTNIRK